MAYKLNKLHKLCGLRAVLRPVVSVEHLSPSCSATLHWGYSTPVLTLVRPFFQNLIQQIIPLPKPILKRWRNAGKSCSHLVQLHYLNAIHQYDITETPSQIYCWKSERETCRTCKEAEDYFWATDVLPGRMGKNPKRKNSNTLSWRKEVVTDSYSFPRRNYKVLTERVSKRLHRAFFIITLKL